MKSFFLVMWRWNKAVLRLLWFALTRPGRPEWLMPVAVAVELYAIAPFNLAVHRLELSMIWSWY